MEVKMADIVEAIGSNVIKNGTTVVGVYPTASGIGLYNNYVKNTPTIVDIENKYSDKFDDPTYYTA
jgi:hypothetical protein